MKKIIALLIAAMMLTAVCAVCVSAEEDLELNIPLAAGNELVNVAEGKSYVPTLGEGSDWRTDNFGDGENGVNQKLTDGVRNEADGGGAVTGAYTGALVDLVVDLGEEFTSLKKFSIDNFWVTSWGIAQGTSVEYLISSDGTNFTSLGVVLTEDAAVIVENPEGWNGEDYILELDEAVSAKYVQIKFVGGNYLWASEIQIFNEQEATVEEPSTEEPTTKTGDSGYIAIAIIALVSLAAVAVVKKSR